MSLVDRHRVAKAIEYSALERKLKGPERLLRESDVANLVKAAYDDAAGPARAEFMERIKKIPQLTLPWSAVAVAPPQAPAPKGKLGDLIVVPKAPAGLTSIPAIALLLRGQVDNPEAEPGNRIPERNSVEGMDYEPLYQALDTWNTAALLKWVGPQGWAVPGLAPPKDPAPPQEPPNNSGVVPPKVDPNATEGAPADKPAPPVDTPAPEPPRDDAALVPSKIPNTALLVAGGVVLAVVVGTSVYWMTARRDARRLEDALRNWRPS